MDKGIALKILKEHTFKTIGCTDPIAAGLAAARAYKEIGGDIKRIVVIMDKNVYKDAISVGIPGTMRSGLALAVALSVLYGNPDDGLELLKGINKDNIQAAEEFAKSHEICFGLKENVNGIYVEATVETSNGQARALIRNSHGNIVEVCVNGEVKNSYAINENISDPVMALKNISDVTIDDILQFVQEVDIQDIDFLLDGVRVNLNASEMGEKERAGLGTGAFYSELIRDGILSDDIINNIKRRVGAAADARMAGIDVPIFGCFGSGNHGITLFITMGMMGRHLKADREQLARALAVALLVVGIIKTRTGILTPHCGCSVAAGTGAAAGIAYMLGGSSSQIRNAVHLMMANLTGMICDGAKYGCSLKMVTAAGTAVESAYLAMKGVQVPGNNGVVGYTLGKTMD
ncbi:MAG: L-serine ammonia-lyase, iron-sulfur-dependent, subunit alpha, partial [Bacillota bacterium]|nr:L-serine ammonia-lyase, iron-sulfur-dependent, subunit alpha [Bacillota bacterium]